MFDEYQYPTSTMLTVARIIAQGIVIVLALAAAVFLLGGDQALAASFAVFALATAWIPILLRRPAPSRWS